MGFPVAVLRTEKRQTFAINSMAAARYRDRHSVSRKKSDPGDALVLENILCADMHAHRPFSQDSALARAVAVLARARQDATWNRQQISNQLRSLLREYYPAALVAVESWKNGLCRPRGPRDPQVGPNTYHGRSTAPYAVCRPRSSRLALSAASQPTPSGSARSSGPTGSTSRIGRRHTRQADARAPGPTGSSLHRRRQGGTPPCRTIRPGACTDNVALSERN
ncbi:transposase [Streptomyces sp. NPDC057966]|uniref:IS110 family transposase n=1 Tax=Streptomyces sp. NPDC057966 TaxID=3346292 RepID=UPI0036EFA81A